MRNNTLSIGFSDIDCGMKNLQIRPCESKNTDGQYSTIGFFDMHLRAEGTSIPSPTTIKIFFDRAPPTSPQQVLVVRGGGGYLFHCRSALLAAFDA